MYIYLVKKLKVIAVKLQKRLVWAAKKTGGWAKKHPYRSVVAGMLVLLWLCCLPRPLFKAPFSAVLEDRAGALLGARIAADGQWRFPVNDSLPDKYVRSVLMFEDQHFYYHPGVNPASIVRALWQNLSSGRTVSGGSTLTMQVIRMARGNPSRTVLQKIVEVFMATRLELTWSKKEIIQLYAAHAPFGGNVVGIDAASWRYFGKKTTSLTWAEAAVLAILPNSPALVHPGRSRTLLLEKRNRLLQRLAAAGYLEPYELDLSLSEPLPDKPLPLPQLAPHLLDRLQHQSQTEAVHHTSINKAFQVRITEILAQRQAIARGNEVHNMAAIVLDVVTGEVLAYVGNVQGAGAEHGEQVDILVAPRSTGSILKPYLYAWSLQSGDILPESLLPDLPTQFGGYQPENYKETYDGAVSARFALIRSLNIPFVHLLRSHGLEKFHYELGQLGLTTINKPPDHYGLSLILGGAEATLGEITNVYACMARRLGGFYARDGQVSTTDFRPYTLLAGQKAPKGSLQRTGNGLSAGAIWHTFLAMQEVERPNSSGEWEMFRSGRRIAWKTGTSFGFRDAWAVGTNARYAVGVWVGNADGEGRPGLIGVEMAAPVLFEIFNQLPGGDDWFDPPYDDMAPLSVCHQSGFRAGEYCPADTVWVPKPCANAPTCSNHQLIHLDAAGQFQVNSSCAEPQTMQHIPWFVLEPQEEYYYRARHPEYQPPPAWKPDCAGGLDESAHTSMRMIYPRQHAQIFIPVDLDGKLSSVIFHAAHRDPNAEIFWHLDEQFVGATKTFHQLPLQPAIGQHTVTLVDKSGQRYVRTFEVIGK